MPAYSTVQAGSTVIGSASGDSLIVATGDADQFGIGASVIVWPSGQPLEGATPYDTMEITAKSGATLTVLRNEDHASATIAEGDQVGLMFPQTVFSDHHQTQVLIVGKTPGNGPAIDLGEGAIGVVGLVTATIENVNLDGGTPGSTHIQIDADGSFTGSDWGFNVTTASGIYANPSWTVCFFTADDPAPLYAQFLMSRYLRFRWNWDGPSDLGASASAKITFDITYY